MIAALLICTLINTPGTALRFDEALTTLEIQRGSRTERLLTRERIYVPGRNANYDRLRECQQGERVSAEGRLQTVFDCDSRFSRFEIFFDRMGKIESRLTIPFTGSETQVLEFKDCR